MRSPRILKLFKPFSGVELQATPVTSQKKDQLTCGRCRILSDITALYYPTFTATSRLHSESFLHKTY